MKTNLLIKIYLLCLAALIYGCSSNEKENDIEDFVIDNTTYEVWDGNGLPTWLRERVFDFMINDTDWITSSCYAPTFYEIEKSYYKNNWLISVTYNRFETGGNNEVGTLCYTNNGKRLKFEDIKNDFANNSVLLWTNRMVGDNIPKVSDFKLENIESLGWLQECINEICSEKGLFIHEIACGYAKDEINTYIILDYKYFDKQNPEKGETIVRNMYTLDGKKVDFIQDFNEEKLCSQRIVNILEYL